MIVQVAYVDGSPQGYRKLQVPNRTHCLHVFPRSALSEVFPPTSATGHADDVQDGVYVLLGDSQERPLHLYIGQSRDIAPRLSLHQRQREWWSTAVVCSRNDGQPLDSGVRQYLEAALQARARRAQEAGWVELEGQAENKRGLGEDSHYVGRDILRDLDFLLPLVGLESLCSGVYAAERSRDTSEPERDQPVFTLEVRPRGGRPPITARMVVRGPDEFVVLEGSQAAEDDSGIDARHAHIRRNREKLLEQGVLHASNPGEPYRFSRDERFDTPSRAAEVVLGRAADGYDVWKNPQLELRRFLFDSGWLPRRASPPPQDE